MSQIDAADIDLTTAEAGLLAWPVAGLHGSMNCVAAQGSRDARPG